MPDEGIGQRHLELLRAIDEVARRDPAGVSTMYQAAQKIGLNPVGRSPRVRAAGTRPRGSRLRGRLRDNLPGAASVILGYGGGA